MSQTTSNKRQQGRFLGVAQVVCCHTPGKVFNLSYSGVGFVIATNADRFVPEATEPLQLKVAQNELFPEGVSLNLTGIIRRKQIEDDGQVTIGMEWGSLAEQDKILIQKLVDFLADANNFWGIN